MKKICVSTEFYINGRKKFSFNFKHCKRVNCKACNGNPGHRCKLHAINVNRLTQAFMGCLHISFIDTWRLATVVYHDFEFEKIPYCNAMKKLRRYYRYFILPLLYSSSKHIDEIKIIIN